MTEKRFHYNVNKNSIEYNEKHFAYCNGEQNKIANKLNELHEEKETYKTLYEEMSYYFRDGVTLRDLDHKDFHSLQRLAKGLVD